MTNPNIRTRESTVFITTDDMEFLDYHKAEAHEAKLTISKMVREETGGGMNDLTHDEVVNIVCQVGMYVPASVWEDLRK